MPFEHNTEFRRCQTYLYQIGLAKEVKTYTEFYEGKQWAPVTEDTQDFPRPVINILKMICKNKKAGVLSSKVKMSFLTSVDNPNIERFNDFAEYMQRELQQPKKDARAVKKASIKGSALFHYYWERGATGLTSEYKGALRCEVIDTMNVAVSDPSEQDIQSQEWVMFRLRKPLESVKKLADTEERLALVAEDMDNESVYNEPEKEGEKYTTLFIRYFRKDGEVYYEKAVKSGVIYGPYSLTPSTNAKKLAEEEGFEDESLVEATSVVENIVGTKKFIKNYPIVFYNWEEREDSLWGIGEVESIISNQKAVNFGIAMQLLNAQNQAWGKWIVKPDSLQEQEITNDPGQVITDYSKYEKGIYRSQEASMSSVPVDLITKLVDLTRVVTGSSEVITGEVMGANMSGAAIAALQSQALKPIDELQKTFWIAKEEQGLIYSDFMRFYYKDYQFDYSSKNPTTMKKEKKIGIFNSSDFSDLDFSVVVEAGAASTFSEASDINALDNLLAKGAISEKTYIKAFPKGALSVRQELLDSIEEEERSENTLLKSQLLQFQEQMKKAADIIERQVETIDSATQIIQKNRNLESLLIELQAEYTSKINKANYQLKQMESSGKIAATDAAEFARIIAEMSAKNITDVGGQK